jgi:sugar phosphate isomerase/epimerase
MLSLSEISTVSASFRDDLRAYAAAGFDGIGIWEMKLGANDEDNLEAVRASGLSVTNCVPLVPSILPNTVIEGPEDVETRIESLCASVRRFAPFEPDCVLCLTGPAGKRSDEEARRLAIDGLQRIAAAADEEGVRLGLEPIHASERDSLTLITSIPDAVELLDEAGLPNAGIMIDLWHLVDTPDVERHLTDNVDRITGVHVASWFEGERGDRALPEGASLTSELMRVLRDAGWEGAWDVEIFGDPARPDSLWSLDVDEAARRAYAAISASIASTRRSISENADVHKP